MSVTVSTIVPAYNAERTIAQAVDSALSQNIEDHEVIVVNDGSTDSTALILEKYGNRIVVVTQPNGGLSAARNAGIRSSRSKYVALLDADDIWLPGKLKTMVYALDRNPFASMAFSELRRFDDTGADHGTSSIGHAPSIEEIQTLPPILPSTWLIRRCMLEQTGGFCERFKGAGGCDDSWMILLLRELGEFIYVPECLTLYRISQSGTNADKYAHGVSVFVALVKQRYGTDGKRAIRSAKNFLCRQLLSKVAHQMNNGDKWSATCTLVRIAKVRPAYFICAEFRNRLFLPQNMRRARNLIRMYTHV